MQKTDYIDYWIKTSDNDLSSMDANFQAGKYDWALFIGHLALEIILKALWVKNKEGNIPPKLHNLMKLAEEVDYPFSQEESFLFLEINNFNLEARYPDYKFEFHKKCTKDFAEGYILKIKELHKCILKQI